MRLRENPTGEAWEAQFSAAIALLRSVGNVLHKQKTKKWWDDLTRTKETDHAIFWKFVDDERNLILKEGHLRAGQSAMVFLQGVSAAGVAGGQTPIAPTVAATAPKPTHHYHVHDGVFIGRDPRDLIDAAIIWWHTELHSIEAASGP